MNKQRRKQLKEIQNNLVKLMDALEMIRDDEQDSFDARPESLQYSQSGEESQDAIDNMDDAVSSIVSVNDKIDEIMSLLEDANGSIDMCI